MIKIYPYKMGSRSARALAQSLGGLRVKEDSTTFHPRNHHIINWGNPRLPHWFGYCADATWWNHPLAVQQCSNKLLFFKLLQEEGLQDCIPEFTTDREVAVSWESALIARSLLNSSAGKGAVYYGREQAHGMPEDYKLYVKYIKKKDEYRVHFGPLGIFHIQQKRKRLEEDADFKIRNHDNGWVFTINDVNPPDPVMDVCRRVVAALPLDFGALDVVYNEHYGFAKVLEVNTACGLEGTTLRKYTDMFTEICK